MDVSRIPEKQNQQAQNLHLHLSGTASNFQSNIDEAARTDFEQALEQLRNRYTGPDQNRKF